MDAQKIFQTLSTRAENYPVIVEQFNKMDRAKQQDFLTSVAKQLGIEDKVPEEPVGVSKKEYEQMGGVERLATSTLIGAKATAKGLIPFDLANRAGAALKAAGGALGETAGALLTGEPPTEEVKSFEERYEEEAEKLHQQDVELEELNPWLWNIALFAGIFKNPLIRGTTKAGAGTAKWLATRAAPLVSTLPRRLAVEGLVGGGLYGAAEGLAGEAGEGISAGRGLKEGGIMAGISMIPAVGLAGAKAALEVGKIPIKAAYKGMKSLFGIFRPELKAALGEVETLAKKGTKIRGAGAAGAKQEAVTGLDTFAAELRDAAAKGEQEAMQGASADIQEAVAGLGEKIGGIADEMVGATKEKLTQLAAGLASSVRDSHTALNLWYKSALTELKPILDKVVFKPQAAARGLAEKMLQQGWFIQTGEHSFAVHPQLQGESRSLARMLLFQYEQLKQPTASLTKMVQIKQTIGDFADFSKEATAATKPLREVYMDLREAILGKLGSVDAPTAGLYKKMNERYSRMRSAIDPLRRTILMGKKGAETNEILAVREELEKYAKWMLGGEETLEKASLVWKAKKAFRGLPEVGGKIDEAIDTAVAYTRESQIRAGKVRGVREGLKKVLETGDANVPADAVKMQDLLRLHEQQAKFLEVGVRKGKIPGVLADALEDAERMTKVRATLADNPKALKALDRLESATKQRKHLEGIFGKNRQELAQIVGSDEKQRAVFDTLASIYPEEVGALVTKYQHAQTILKVQKLAPKLPWGAGYGARRVGATLGTGVGGWMLGGPAGAMAGIVLTDMMQRPDRYALFLYKTGTVKNFQKASEIALKISRGYFNLTKMADKQLGD